MQQLSENREAREVQLSQLFSQQQSNAETSLDRSDLLEAAGNIKILGMGIPGYV